MSLRITDVPTTGPNENADKCADLALGVINKIPGVKVTKCDIQRAHRVGKVNSSKPRQIIVKFKAWQTRTSIYKGRRSLVDNKIFLDLTKRRFNLKKLAVERVQDNDMVDFVFSDINCSLCLRSSDGKFRYFNSDSELEKILSDIASV